MAKLTYKLPVMEYLGDFEGDFDLTVDKGGKSATWENEETGAKLVVNGSKLVDADEGDHLENGTVTGLKLFNGDNKLLVDVTGLNLKAEKLSAAFEDGDIPGALTLVTAGNDTVIGSKKGEYLFSGGGNDVLSGKGGSDTFSFHVPDFDEMGKKSGERDVITDFVTKGKDVDYLEIMADDIAKTATINNKRDTQLTFDDGSTLVLEDVTAKEWKAYVNAYMDNPDM